MPRKKRSSSPFELFDDDLDEDASSQSSKNGNPPIQRNAANARERARMRVLSSAFGRLKTKLPNIPPDTKLSKLDTLRLATMYIKQLKGVVEGGANVENLDSVLTEEQVGRVANFQHSATSMSWPFGFHHIQNASRQLSFPYSSMDWNHSPETYTKCPRLDDDNYSHHQNSYPNDYWFMEGSTASEVNNSNSCVYHNQNHHNQRSQHLHQHQLHDENAPTPIR